MDKVKTSHSLLHAYCIKPAYRFETQQADEQIILMLRAHPITQLPWILNSFFLFVLLVFLNFLFPQFFSTSQIIFLNLFGGTVIFSYIWFNILSWFFNVGIITNERIIDVDFHGVIYKEVTETKLSKVEDVTTKSGGFIASLFNYGNVFIQTAGTELNIEFINIPKPSEATKIINDLIT
ncbi:PH domain-containing protein [Candidatus Roizmanbacteria bacterium]|nr:PH domain-containing protein [Candidatus Roizmanbacteria bacterium]